MGPQEIQLPQPRQSGSLDVETAIRTRRSIRRFRPDAISLSDASQLLWAAQGVSDPKGYRTTPSAGALYPLEVLLVAGAVTELETGVYRYLPAHHALAPISVGEDRREWVFAAALRQSAIRKAPAVIAFCAVYERMTGKYGRRGIQYVHMEAGHAAQNVSLQAVALGLETVAIGAFEDERVREALAVPKPEVPLYLVPVGRV